VSVAEHPALNQPAVFEVIPQNQADASVQATREKLHTLQSHVDTLTAEVEELEERMRAEGATPQAAVDASDRLDVAIAQLRLDASAYADRVLASARLDAEALVADARSRADFAAEPYSPPVPVAEAAAPPPPTQAARGLEELSWVTVGPVHVEEYIGYDDDEDTNEDQRAFARTVGLLQVVLWSVLIAAGLIVGLAWFA
jgi:outer membrane murein-binding lipoprotein Lpp